jgi:hydroxyethylthiazole kinase
MFERLNYYIEKIKTKKPLILSLTNYVSIDFVANALLAIGTAPIMSESEDEIEELVSMSSCVYLNIGTLDDHFMSRARELIKYAKKFNKPLIFDPVGSGATKLRTKATLEILPNANVVRGNASEILSIGSNFTKTFGVESVNTSQEAISSGNLISGKCDNIIVISSATDIIISTLKTKQIKFGTPIMQHVTGMGCCLSSVIAAFCAVDADFFESSLFATMFFNLSGEKAASITQKVGSFKVAFIDNLYSPDLEFIKNKLEK